MDKKAIFRKVLDKYQGQNKKQLESLWQYAEREGFLDAYLDNLLATNAKDAGVSTEQVLSSWQHFADNASEQEAGAYFESLDGDRRFGENINDALNDAEKGLLKVDDLKDRESLDFPSMDDPNEQSRMSKLKFAAEVARDEALQLAQRKADRLYALEQEIISRQGGVVNMQDGDFEKWQKDNPEFMERKHEEWAEQDERIKEHRDAVRNIPGSGLYDED